jgi:hypothetical protein
MTVWRAWFPGLLGSWLLAEAVLYSEPATAAPAEETTAALSGSVHSLVGTGLTLETNAGDVVTVPSGARAYAFANRVPFGTEYRVHIASQPTSPVQTCVLRNDHGTALTDVVNLSVVCFQRIPRRR